MKNQAFSEKEYAEIVDESMMPGSEKMLLSSSDIVESVFGVYKYRRARNQLHGITPYVMVIPLMTAVGHESKPSSINFKEHLENVFMKDLSRWTENVLTDNLAVKRRKMLSA